MSNLKPSASWEFLLGDNWRMLAVHGFADMSKECYWPEVGFCSSAFDIAALFCTVVRLLFLCVHLSRSNQFHVLSKRLNAVLNQLVYQWIYSTWVKCLRVIYLVLTTFWTTVVLANSADWDMHTGLVHGLCRTPVELSLFQNKSFTPWAVFLLFYFVVWLTAQKGQSTLCSYPRCKCHTGRRGRPAGLNKL